MNKKQNVKTDILTVAKAAKVSASTVSRYFNHPDLLKPATRKRIQRAVERTGYIRNRAAQTIHGRRSATIGLIVPTIDHAIFSEVIQSFSDAIDRSGFTLLLATHGYDLEREYEMLRKLLEHRVDGVALVGLDHSEAAERLLLRQAVPTISIWNYAPDSPHSCVGADNAAAGALAARHLVDLGHRRIGLLFPPTEGNDRARQRFEGAMTVFERAGADIRPEWRSTTPYSLAQAKSVVLDLLAQPARPTAILCGNDVIAQGAVFGAQEAGVQVPQALSVIGIGDFNGSGEIHPGLTTIRIPATEIGRVAGTWFAEAIIKGGDEIFRYCCDITCIRRGTTCVCSGAFQVSPETENPFAT